LEIKAVKTIRPDFFKRLCYFQTLDVQAELYLAYGGSERQVRSDIGVLTWSEISQMLQ
jgi:hypothetical protein